MEHKDNFFRGALVGALAMFIIGIAVIAGMNLVKKDDAVVSKAEEQKLETIKELIDDKYLETIDQKSLTEGLYAGYLSGLSDPYSVYYDEEQTKHMLETTSGEYVGIGALISQNKETKVSTVAQVFENSPALESGMQEGDWILEVDGKDVTSLDVTEVVGKIKGKEGTEVKITIMKQDTGQETEYAMTRRKVETQTVNYEMREGQIGYIRVSQFETVTSKQFAEALADLNAQFMEGLIIDLRSNPGGNLNTVCEMLNMILPKGMIVYTEDKNGEGQEYKSEGKTPFEKPLVVLVNEMSASASEIFAGAVQDYAIGEIVGMTTYGKGIVQQVFDLQDGTSFKMTVSEYFTPKGRNIHGKGIMPDTEVAYEPDPNHTEADNQLDKAIEIVTAKLGVS